MQIILMNEGVVSISIFHYNDLCLARNVFMFMTEHVFELSS